MKKQTTYSDLISDRREAQQAEQDAKHLEKLERQARRVRQYEAVLQPFINLFKELEQDANIAAQLEFIYPHMGPERPVCGFRVLNPERFGYIRKDYEIFYNFAFGNTVGIMERWSKTRFNNGWDHRSKSVPIDKRESLIPELIDIIARVTNG